MVSGTRSGEKTQSKWIHHHFDNWMSRFFSEAIYCFKTVPWLRHVWTSGPTWWPLAAGTVWSKGPKYPRSTPSPPPQSSRPAESHQLRSSNWSVAGCGSCPQSHMTRRPVPLQKKNKQTLGWGQEETGWEMFQTSSDSKFQFGKYKTLLCSLTSLLTFVLEK